MPLPMNDSLRAAMAEVLATHFPGTPGEVRAVALIELRNVLEPFTGSLVGGPLAVKLRERHWKKTVESWDEDEQDFMEHEICNQDGQKWPCFTEQMIRDSQDG